MPFEQFTTLECYQSNVLSLNSEETKFKMVHMFRNYRMLYFSLMLYMLLRFQDILNLTPWKLKKITLLTFPLRVQPFKPSAAVKPLSWHQDIFSQLITLKNWPEKPNDCLWKKKNKYGNSTIAGLIRNKSPGFRPNNDPIVQETLKFPFLTAVQQYTICPLKK